MKKRMFAVVLALVMLFTLVLPVYAATTAEVTVTATPEYISIVDNQTSVDFGIVTASSVPTVATNYVTITNSSSVQTDQTIAVTASSWAGGVGWTHSDTATPGEDIAGLEANRGGTWETGDVIVKYSSPNFIYENCPATTDFDYGLQLIAPTSFTDGVQKTITVRITAAAG